MEWFSWAVGGEDKLVNVIMRLESSTFPVGNFSKKQLAKSCKPPCFQKVDVFPTRIFFQGFPSIFQALSYGSWFFQDGFEKGTQDFVALLESRLTGAGEDDEDEEDEEADEEGDDEDGVGTKKSPKIPFCYAMNFIL